MPPIERVNLLQKALYWEKTGVDAYGQPTRKATFEEIPVRWVPRQNEIMDSAGNPIQIDATVITQQTIKIGSFFWLGSQEDLEAALSGTGTGSDLIPTGEFFQVVTYNETPDLNRREYRRECTVRRWGNTLPEATL